MYLKIRAHLEKLRRITVNRSKCCKESKRSRKRS